MRDYDQRDDYDDLESFRSLQPHRGVMILVLGIVSFILTCFPIGITAIILGRRDMDLMRRGMMDNEGKGMTQAGVILGIVSTIISLLVAGLYAAMFLFVIAAKK
jgi:hypothetical protein